MGKILRNLEMDEISLVKKGFRPKNAEATIEFFKAYPAEEVTPDTSESGFFNWFKKAVEAVVKAMDTSSGANYEQQDLSTNSPGKKKKQKPNPDDPDGDGDIDDSDPALDTDNDKGKGKVKKSMEEFQKAIEDALASVPETIKKAVDEATAPHLESISKAQEEVKAVVEKAGEDIKALVDGAKEEISKAVDDAKIELGRVQKAAPTTESEPVTVIKADTKFGDAIRTLMHSGEAN